MQCKIPVFFLKISKGKNNHMFNPVDNKEYLVNHIGYRILEQCDGAHTIDEISGIMERDFEKANTEAFAYTATFLEKMHIAGIIALRNKKIDYKKNFAPPLMVFWDITGECNLRCAHCYHLNGQLHENELSNEEIKCVLEEMLAFGVENVAFSRGEPFLRKNFLEIASYTRSLGFKSVNIATNGTLIDREIARQFKLKNFNVQVSIDGDVAEIHDSIRGVQGAFNQAIYGIKLLQEEGNDVSVCTTVTKLNVDRISNIKQFIQNLGIKNYRVQDLMPIGRGKKNLKELRLSPRRLKDLVEYLESKKIPLSSYSFTLQPPPTEPVNYCKSGTCSAVTYSCSITPEGKVVPCTHLWGMNGESLRKHTFQWIWENSMILNYFRDIILNDIKGVYLDCKWLSLCHGGCKAENYANGDIFDSNFICWIADEMRQTLL
jgi:radical SAM protein with 4Fe4S-binding SPASM domain